MTTAAERLVQLTGGAGSLTAAQRLRMIGGAAATAGALLVAFSGLPSATAAEHLLADRTAQALPAFGTDDAPVSQLWLTDEQIQRQNELILLTVMSAVTGGMLG